MPELGPFQGIRYSTPSDLKKLVCPPYDVITTEEQVRLHRLHSYNAVRVELPFSEPGDRDQRERYRRAARRFSEWTASGVLRQDPAPALYVYREDFIAEGGTRRRVAGVIGALKLEDLGEGVLAHEQTMPGPVEDRLALMRACPVNISPIYAIYKGSGGLTAFFDSLEHRPTDARFIDDAGTLHRLWVVSAPAERDLLASAISEGPLVIADGHHRYETALAYRAQYGAESPGADAVMCFCVDADSEDVVVLPYHRALEAPVPRDELERRLAEHFVTKVLDRDGSPRVLEQSSADHPFVVVLDDKDLLVEVDDTAVVAVVGERPKRWRDIDVVALHEAVLPRVVPEGVERLRFSKDSEEIIRLVRRDGWTAGVLLKALDPLDVFEVARSGERMPQKASYFWPKAVTGLVFRVLR